MARLCPEAVGVLGFTDRTRQAPDSTCVCCSHSTCPQICWVTWSKWKSSRHGRERNYLGYYEDLVKFPYSEYEFILVTAQEGFHISPLPKRVVVGGAGMSGLVGGKALQDGHQDSVLEASNHVGGGITISNEEEGWYYELGPKRNSKFHSSKDSNNSPPRAWFRPQAQPVLSAASAATTSASPAAPLLGSFLSVNYTTLNKFILYDGNTWHLINKQCHCTRKVKANSELLGYWVNPTEKSKNASEIFNCSHLMSFYDSYFAKTYLLKEGMLSPGAVEMVRDRKIRTLNSFFYVTLVVPSRLEDYISTVRD
ncbi:LOW QUALITY PROTEIN: L-amino acid oxidase-like [Rhynchonycteris naso]